MDPFLQEMSLHILILSTTGHADVAEWYASMNLVGAVGVARSWNNPHQRHGRSIPKRQRPSTGCYYIDIHAALTHGSLISLSK